MGPQLALNAQGEAVAVWDRMVGSVWIVEAASRPAASSWQPPIQLVTVAGPLNTPPNPKVALNAQGEAVAVWDRPDGNVMVAEAASRPAGGSWQAPVALVVADGNPLAPEVALNSAGEAVAVWASWHGCSSTGCTSENIEATSRTAGGAWRQPVSISATAMPEFAYGPRVALDAQGEAVAIWSTGLSEGGHYGDATYNSTEFVEAASRPAGEAWQKPVKLSPPDPGEPYYPQLALDAQGDAVVVWERRIEFIGTDVVVEAASRPADGTWQQPAELAASGELPQVAIGSHGEALAVWERVANWQQSNESTIVEAASRPVAGEWQQPLELAAGVDTEASPQIATDDEGDAISVWEHYEGSNMLVEAASRPAGGNWQPPTTLSPPSANAYVPQLAMNAPGQAVALWERFEGQTNRFIEAAEYFVTPSTACTGNSGTVTLSPGLTDRAAVQTMKINGTLTGCAAEPFTTVNYTATLKTADAVSCSVLTGAGEPAGGATKYKWTPNAKVSTGTLSVPLTQMPGVSFSGEVTAGSYSPLTLAGAATESFAGGATCGEKVGKKASKAVKKGTFVGSAVSFE